MRAPAWVLRPTGVGPKGLRLHPGQRLLLRILCSLADENCWSGRSNGYLADEVASLTGGAPPHRSTIYRQLRSLAGLGILHAEERQIAGRIRQGWRLDLTRLDVLPSEQVVDLAEQRRLRAEVSALRRRVLELEAELAHGRNVADVAPEPQRASLDGPRALAQQISAERVAFVIDGRHRIYGEAHELHQLAAAGLVGPVHTESLWPARKVRLEDSQGALRMLALLLQDEPPAAVLETLRWYRAELADEPDQLKWYGAHFTRPHVYQEAHRRAAEAKPRHQRRLEALLERATPRAPVPADKGPTTADKGPTTAENPDEHRAALSLLGRRRAPPKDTHDPTT